MESTNNIPENLQVIGGFEVIEQSSYLGVGSIAFLFIGGLLAYKVLERVIYFKALNTIMIVLISAFLGYLVYVYIMLSGFILPAWTWAFLGFILPHILKMRSQFIEKSRNV